MKTVRKFVWYRSFEGNEVARSYARLGDGEAEQGRPPDKIGTYEIDEDGHEQWLSDEPYDPSKVLLVASERLGHRVGCDVQGRLNAFVREAEAGRDNNARAELLALLVFFVEPGATIRYSSKPTNQSRYAQERASVRRDREFDAQIQEDISESRS